MTKSDGTIRDANGKRVCFLFFGTPINGKNGGNTASGTWELIKIINATKKDKSNKDGGWTEALKACIIMNCTVCI